jgi:hypothetical protein
LPGASIIPIQGGRLDLARCSLVILPRLPGTL